MSLNESSDAEPYRHLCKGFEPEQQVQFLKLVTTGEASDKFLEQLDKDPVLQKAVEDAYRLDVASAQAKLPQLVPGAEAARPPRAKPAMFDLMTAVTPVLSQPAPAPVFALEMPRTRRWQGLRSSLWGGVVAASIGGVLILSVLSWQLANQKTALKIEFDQNVQSAALEQRLDFLVARVKNATAILADRGNPLPDLKPAGEELVMAVKEMRDAKVEPDVRLAVKNLSRLAQEPGEELSQWAFGILPEVSSHKDFPILVGGLHSSNKKVRHGFTMVLEKVVDQDLNAALPFLTEAYRDPKARVHTIKLLWHYDPIADQAAPLLLQAVGDDDPAVRRAACDSAIKIGRGASAKFVSAWVRHLEKADDLTKLEGQRVLIKIGQDPKDQRTFDEIMNKEIARYPSSEPMSRFLHDTVDKIKEKR